MLLRCGGVIPPLNKKLMKIRELIKLEGCNDSAVSGGRQLALSEAFLLPIAAKHFYALKNPYI